MYAPLGYGYGYGFNPGVKLPYFATLEQQGHNIPLRGTYRYTVTRVLVWEGRSPSMHHQGRGALPLMSRVHPGPWQAGEPGDTPCTCIALDASCMPFGRRSDEYRKVRLSSSVPLPSWVRSWYLFYLPSGTERAVLFTTFS